MDGERDILLCQRSQSGLGDDMLAILQDFAGKSSQEESERSLLRFIVWKSNYDHFLASFR
jgi:hypothetical protein